MHRIDTSTAASALPEFSSAGTPGYFTEGDPEGGIPATIPGQDWFNMVQEELASIVEAASIIPTKGENDQILQAIMALMARYYAESTGNSNAYILTLPIAITAHAAGMPILFKSNFTNTGAATININGLGAVAIKKNGGEALSANDIVSGQIITVVYDGAYYQLDRQAIPYATSSGSANAYVLTLSPARVAHIPGMPILFKANFTNTGAATININGLGAVSIKKYDNTDLSADDIVSGQLVIIAYDGTYYQELLIPPIGTICQQVYTQSNSVITGSGSDTIPSDNTIPQITEGKQVLICSITPKSSISKLKIEIKTWSSIAAGGGITTIALFQNSDPDALAVAKHEVYNGNEFQETILTHFMTAGTTSQISFSVRMGCGGSAWGFNGDYLGATLYGGKMYSSISVTEIKA